MFHSSSSRPVDWPDPVESPLVKTRAVVRERWDWPIWVVVNKYVDFILFELNSTSLLLSIEVIMPLSKLDYAIIKDVNE